MVHPGRAVDIDRTLGSQGVEKALANGCPTLLPRHGVCEGKVEAVHAWVGTPWLVRNGLTDARDHKLDIVALEQLSMCLKRGTT